MKSSEYELLAAAEARARLRPACSTLGSLLDWSDTMRVVHVSNGPLPYHTPILNELAKLVDLHVIYMSRDHPLKDFYDLWGTRPNFEHEFYWSIPIRWRQSDFRAQVSLGVSRRLHSIRPDTILVISWGPLAIEPLLWRKVADARAVMWVESTEWSGLFRGPVSTRIRGQIVALADTVVAESSSATTYARALGAIRVITSCLPSPLFRAAALASRSDLDKASPIYLFVGRLIPRKRPLELIDAFQSARSEIPGAELVIVGDGVLRENVVHAARHAGEHVKVLPRLEGARLAEVYRRADILVLPSLREGWGLVVNEALAHGLFVVASDQVASALDLLDGENGMLFPATSSHALQRALVEAGLNVSRTDEARRRRAKSVEGCTPARFAADLHRAACAAWNE